MTCILHSAHTHTHLTGPLSGHMSRYQKGKTNLDFTEARDMNGSGISWAICKSAHHSRLINTPAHSVFLQAGCPSCHPTNSVKALKARACILHIHYFPCTIYKKNKMISALFSVHHGLNIAYMHAIGGKTVLRSSYFLPTHCCQITDMYKRYFIVFLSMVDALTPHSALLSVCEVVICQWSEFH